MKVATYMPSGTIDTARGFSQSLWGDCDWDGIVAGQNEFRGAKWFYEDFNMMGNADMSSAYKNSIGQWSVYGYAGATIVDAGLDGGVAQFGADGDNEGVCLLSSAGAFQIATSATALCQKLWFEACVATSTVAATKRDDFVGLVIPALSSSLPRVAYPITTTDDTLDATNGTFIGFHRKGTAAPTDWQFCFNLAGGTVNYVTNLTTLLASVNSYVSTPVISPLVANQFVKLGFVFDPAAITGLVGAKPTARQTQGQMSRKLIRVFCDGFELPTYLSNLDVLNQTAGQAFPTGIMGPCFATMNQTGTTPGTMLADWMRAAQMPNA